MIYKWVLDNIKGDRWIWFIALSLSILSLLVVYSATGSLAYQKMQGNTEYYLFKHFFLILLSFVAMWFTHKIDYKYFSQLSKISLYACIPLLLFTWKFGLNINDASRWINIPILNQAFQPSDLAKLSLIVYLSSYLSKHQMDIKNIKETLIFPLIWISVICLLIALTNFSSSVLLFVTSIILLFISRVPIKYLTLSIFSYNLLVVIFYNLFL